ncbi:MAG TPA: hypothetical protein VMD53_03415 [Rhizomicrobium sp.]|nr:hypothetical protein [Rhizomicrobium sp.]
MRAGPVFMGLFLLAATRALAQPPAIILPEPPFVDHSAAHLPLSDSGMFQDVTPEGQSRALARGQFAASPRAPSLGPFSMDIGSSDIGRDGKRAHFAHLHLDDFHPLGSNVSGTFDGRAATFRLSWPTGQ